MFPVCCASVGDKADVGYVVEFPREYVGFCEELNELIAGVWLFVDVLWQVVDDGFGQLFVQPHEAQFRGVECQGACGWVGFGALTCKL